MRKFDIIICNVLKMKGCRNAPGSLAMSVCLVPVNVTIVESNYVCVLGGGMRHMCVHL